jgi:hypothetical protein
MENANKVLLGKKSELARVKRKVEALRIVAPLLWDEKDQWSEPTGATLTQFALALDRRLSRPIKLVSKRMA